MSVHSITKTGIEKHRESTSVEAAIGEVMNLARRKKRKEDVKQRASQPDSMYSYCRAVGCPNPARAGTADGLGRLYCRKHHDHYQRHGSLFKPSYKASELNPLRKAATKWLEENLDDAWVQSAVAAVKQLYQSAGPHVEAYRLRGLKPRQRAWAHWARLRTAEVDPVKVVSVWLAVEMVINSDAQPDWRPEYKRVQAAKVVHRMASGSHKKWTRDRLDGSGSWTEEMHVYPHSRGRVLRHIGEDLEDACTLLTQHRLGKINK
ncbi:MAG: hypothetical protein AAFW87_12455 [Pseudomonadota bacterium]